MKNSKYPLEYHGKFFSDSWHFWGRILLPSKVRGLGVLLLSSYEIHKMYSVSSSYKRLKYTGSKFGDKINEIPPYVFWIKKKLSSDRSKNLERLTVVSAFYLLEQAFSCLTNIKNGSRLLSVRTWNSTIVQNERSPCVILKV